MTHGIKRTVNENLNFYLNSVVGIPISPVGDNKCILDIAITSYYCLLRSFM